MTWADDPNETPAVVIVWLALRPAKIGALPVSVMPLVSVRFPKIIPVVEKLSAGLPVQENVRSRPALGMSAVIVRPATKALLITTSSWGKGTREVQPCVDQVKLAVPVAVCVAETVAFVVTAPALPSASPMNADPAFVHEAAPE